jgi:hypothetical protein
MISLRAALHPASGNNLFFVAKKDGTHAFVCVLFPAPSTPSMVMNFPFLIYVYFYLMRLLHK